MFITFHNHNFLLFDLEIAEQTDWSFSEKKFPLRAREGKEQPAEIPGPARKDLGFVAHSVSFNNYFNERFQVN